MDFEFLFVMLYALVAAMLFIATLSAIKTFGFFKCLIVMMVVSSLALLAVYTIHTIIIYVVIKILIMLVVL